TVKLSGIWDLPHSRCSGVIVRHIASPREPVLKYIPGASLCFRLHTWGRTLEYHPHVHYVVPGGGLSADGSRWLPSRADFLVPVQALSIVFRAKFRDILKREGLLNLADPAAWRRDQVVHSRPAGADRASLHYLA